MNLPIDPIYLVYGAVFLGAVFLVEGLYYLYSDGFGGRGSANRRMRMLSAGGEARDVFATLRRNSQPRWNGLGIFGNLARWFDRLIMQCGLTVSVERVLFIMGALTVVTFFAGIAVAERIPNIPTGMSITLVAAILSMIIGLAGPILYLTVLKNRRLRRFEEQLPDSLEMMVRSLRAGHPVSVAMALTAKQMSDPIGTELGILVDEMTYGLSLPEALVKMGERLDVQDFQFVVVAITIQHETGGNLADVLSGLAAVMRARFRMFKKIKALSAEGRFSAKILGVLPFAFFAIVFSMQPEYYLAVADDPLAWKIALLGVTLQITGMLIMRKLINFKV